MLMNVALLILRVVVGILFMGHGAQKLFGVFGGLGLAGFADWLQGLGLRPARVWAIVAGVCEFGGGLLFALGLITPIAALALLAVMLMAVATVYWTKGLWVTKGGYEYNLVLSAIAVALALAGPGIYALDYVFGIAWPALATLLIGLAVVIVGVSLALRGIPWALDAWTRQRGPGRLPGTGQAA
jgi:putative oxidoreductase